MDELFCLWQVSEYTWSKFRRVLNMSPALNVGAQNKARF